MATKLKRVRTSHRVLSAPEQQLPAGVKLQVAALQQQEIRAVSTVVMKHNFCDFMTL